MAKYVFICEKCNDKQTKYASPDVETIQCDKCSSDMRRQLPSSFTSEVKETVDSFTNKKWTKDQQEMLKKRRDDHYWKVEVPRLVQTHGLETCLEHGWLKYNDKGELVINKPPSKR